MFFSETYAQTETAAAFIGERRDKVGEVLLHAASDLPNHRPDLLCVYQQLRWAVLWDEHVIVLVIRRGTGSSVTSHLATAVNGGLT